VGGGLAVATEGGERGEGRTEREREILDLGVEKMKNGDLNNQVCSLEKTKFTRAEKKSVD
jgi:hypothetical protein